MKLGLLTDIHEHVAKLRSALDRFERLGVEQVVVIGDVFEMGHTIEPTCRLLAEAGAVGVWGNHDYGLSFEPHPEVARKYPPAVLQFMASLRPRLEIEGCSFTHIEPWLNPEDIGDLWYYDGVPQTAEHLDRIFNGVPQRVMFVGHYHQWLLATPTEFVPWNGDRSICLSGNRYFVVVGAVCEGHCATYDSETEVLTPLRI